MPSKSLSEAVTSVDWNQNVQTFLTKPGAVDSIAKANLRLATWAQQLETADKGNPALCFIREMQVASHHVTALVALSLYKSAAGSMRAVLETALYYSYFRTHPSELATLVRETDFFLFQSDIIEYHKTHTRDFSALQNKFGFIGKLKAWYGYVSSVIHGQIPGTWGSYTSFSDFKHTIVLDEVAKTFCDGEELVHQLFLCTVGRELWDAFSTTAKKKLAAGLHGDVKTALGIDMA